MRTVLATIAAAAILSFTAGDVQAFQQTPPPSSTPAPAPKSTPAPTAPLNLNTATKADLEKLPVIGPAMADRILAYRQKNGSFKKVEELMNVQGIGEKAFLKLRTLITVTPPKTTER